MVELRGVTKIYPGTSDPAVDAIDLQVNRGELLALVGPSGCGKTTTLKMINRIIEPTAGKILIAGSDILGQPAHTLRLGIGYVIQRVGLFPHRTVAQNIATVPSLLGWDHDRIRDRVDELVSLMALDNSLLDRYPASLSGGQQQRVGVARALAADPPVLLMDEPFGAVDPVVRIRLQSELATLQQRLHKTILFVTHDIDEAFRLGDRVAIFNDRGGIEQIASPLELLSDPASPDVHAFVGSQRSLRRASLLPLRTVITAATAPLPISARAGQGVPDHSLVADQTVGDALDTMLELGIDTVDVIDAGQVFRVTFADLRDALQ